MKVSRNDFVNTNSVRIRFLCAIIRPLDCRVKSTSLAASQPRGNVTDVWNVAMCASRIVNLEWHMEGGVSMNDPSQIPS